MVISYHDLRPSDTELISIDWRATSRILRPLIKWLTLHANRNTHKQVHVFKHKQTQYLSPFFLSLTRACALAHTHIHTHTHIGARAGTLLNAK